MRKKEHEGLAKNEGKILLFRNNSEKREKIVKFLHGIFSCTTEVLISSWTRKKKGNEN